MTAEQLEAARAERLRQNGHGALTVEDARTWVEETGLCLYLPRRGQAAQHTVPSFVEAVAGQRDDTPSPEILATAEQLLARLEADGVVVRLNLQGILGEQPDFLVASWVLPYVYALRGDRDWRRPPQLTGSRQVSPLAVQAAKALEPANITVGEIRALLGREVTEAAVLRALNELWAQLRIIPVVTEPGAAALWQPLRQRFQKAIAEGASTSQVTAISVLASIYLQAVIAGTMEEVEIFLSPLTARSKVREVLRGLVATRQIHSTSVGTNSYFYVAGTLPEFPAPVAAYPVPTASGYSRLRNRRGTGYFEEDGSGDDFGGDFTASGSRADSAEDALELTSLAASEDAPAARPVAHRNSGAAKPAPSARPRQSRTTGTHAAHPRERGESTGGTRDRQPRRDGGAARPSNSRATPSPVAASEGRNGQGKGTPARPAQARTGQARTGQALAKPARTSSSRTTPSRTSSNRTGPNRADAGRSAGANGAGSSSKPASRSGQVGNGGYSAAKPAGNARPSSNRGDWVKDNRRQSVGANRSASGRNLTGPGSGTAARQSAAAKSRPGSAGVSASGSSAGERPRSAVAKTAQSANAGAGKRFNYTAQRKQDQRTSS